MTQSAHGYGRMNPRLLLKGLVLIGTFVLFGYLLEVTQLRNALSESWIDSQVRGRGLTGEALFVGVAALATAVGMPRQFIAFLGGYAFGFAAGTALGLLGSAMGCATAFFYSRLIGRELISTRFPGRVRKIDAFMHDNPLSMTLLIRLLPVGSNLVTNLVAGVTSVRARPFILGSALGYIPQTVVFALIGSGIGIDPVLRISIGVLLFVVSGVLGVYLYRRYRHGAALDDATERVLAEDGTDAGPAAEGDAPAGDRERTDG